MQWERPPFKFLPPYSRAPADKLQAIETYLKGMELALASTTSVPKTIELDQLQLKDDDILTLQHQISIKLKQEINSKAESTDYCTTLDKTLQCFQILLPNPQDLPPLFFLFCMKLLFDDARISSAGLCTFCEIGGPQALIQKKLSVAINWSA